MTHAAIIIVITNSWLRKTMYLGSLRRFWSLLYVLFWKKNLRYYYVVYVCYFTMVTTYMLYHKFRNDKNNFRSLLFPRGSGRQVFVIWLFCTCFTDKFRFFAVQFLVWIRCLVIMTFLMQTPSRRDSSFAAGLGLLSCSKMTKIKYTNYQL